MNYLQARERHDGGGWHFTAMNDGVIWPIGNCSQHPPHATQEEAERCYYEWELDTAMYSSPADPPALHRCEVPECGDFTGASARYGWSIRADVSLCAKHLNRDGLALAHPFTPGIAITTS